MQKVHIAIASGLALLSVSGCVTMSTAELQSAVGPSSSDSACKTTAITTTALPPTAEVTWLVPRILRNMTGSTLADDPLYKDWNFWTPMKPAKRLLLPMLKGDSSVAIGAIPNTVIERSYAQAAQLASSLSIAAALARLHDLRTAGITTLQSDKVFNALLDAVISTAASAQQNIARDASLAGPLFTVPTKATGLPAVALSERDFRAFALLARKLAVTPGLAYGTPSSPVAKTALAVSYRTEQTEPTFSELFIDYFKDYYRGTYVDRFGTALTKPALSRTISDAEISGAVQVLWDLLFDYTFRTPVWKDSHGSYYPGDNSNEPTVAVYNVVSPISLLTEADSEKCGITPLKAQAIAYLSNAASNSASSLGGLVGGSAGGIGFSLGFLGKFSLGDNQTLQALVKASLGTGARRAAEEASYRTFFWIPYSSGTTLSQLLKQYLSAKSQ